MVVVRLVGEGDAVDWPPGVARRRPRDLRQVIAAPVRGSPGPVARGDHPAPARAPAPRRRPTSGRRGPASGERRSGPASGGSSGDSSPVLEGFSIRQSNF